MTHQIQLDFKRARSHDPVTSFISGERVGRFSSKHYETIIKALKALGSGTAKDIARITSLDSIQVSRRLPEMERLGIVRVVYQNCTLLKKDGCRVWELV